MRDFRWLKFGLVNTTNVCDRTHTYIFPHARRGLRVNPNLQIAFGQGYNENSDQVQRVCHPPRKMKITKAEKRGLFMVDVSTPVILIFLLSEIHE